MVRRARELRGHVKKVFPLHSPPANGHAVAAPQGIASAPLALIPAPGACDVVLRLVHQPPLEQRPVFAHRVRRVPAGARERHVAQLLPVARQRRRHVPLHVVGAVYPRGEVFRAHDDPAGVRGPGEARGLVVHPAVRSKKSKRRKLFEHRRRGPDLHELTDAHGEGPTARGELAVRNLALEVHVVQHHAFPEVDQQRATVGIERYHV
mmetsp:Transcript_11457/g.49346  ORF Transcript_11457/g.49346 Transcript_11457/m.49346 type:complete len:207 (+) Transcript_11457:1238-1858(+)